MDFSGQYINVYFPQCDAVRVPFEGNVLTVRRFLCIYHRDKFPGISDGALIFHHAKVGELDVLTPLMKWFDEEDFPVRLDVVIWLQPDILSLAATTVWSLCAFTVTTKKVEMKEKETAKESDEETPLIDRNKAPVQYH